MKRWRISLESGHGVVGFDCMSGMTIETAARLAGLRMRTSCRGGGCGICAASLLAGEVHYPQAVSGPRLAQAGPGAVFLCRAVPQSDCRIQASWQWTSVDRTPLSRRVTTSPEGKGGTASGNHQA